MTSARDHAKEAQEWLREHAGWVEGLERPLAAEFSRIASEATRAERERCAARELVPDMWWNSDDPEGQYDGPEEWAREEWGEAHGSVEVTFQTGFRGADTRVRITAVADGDDVDYVVEHLAQPVALSSIPPQPSEGERG